MAPPTGTERMCGFLLFRDFRRRTRLAKMSFLRDKTQTKRTGRLQCGRKTDTPVKIDSDDDNDKPAKKKNITIARTLGPGGLSVVVGGVCSGAHQAQVHI